MNSIHVALALVWKGARLLIAHRRKGAHLGGFWEFPGGSIEDGESAADAAVREVREETSVVCTAANVRLSFEFEYPDRAIVFHPVDCDWVSGEPEALGCSGARWVSCKQIAQYAFPPANCGLLRELLQSTSGDSSTRTRLR
jgi:mutator protein MutT